MFFSFDGIDGAGKSTQVALFCNWLQREGHDVVACRDPGSTPLGERVRELLLTADGGCPIHRRTEMFLYMAARCQLVEEAIRPALAEGKLVVADRFVLANIVYQGHAGGLDVEQVRWVGTVCTGDVVPDCTFLLDIPPEEAEKRFTRELDRIELQGIAFQRRLRAGFLAEAANSPDRIHVIDASRSVDLIQQQIQAIAEASLRAPSISETRHPRATGA